MDLEGKERMILETIKDTSPWISGDLKKWDVLIAELTPVQYRKNTFLFMQGELYRNFYIVKSGRVRIFLSHESGVEQQLYFALEGCMLSGSFDPDKMHACSATAIVDSWVYRIPCAKMYEMCKENWTISELLIQDLVRKQGIYRQHITSFAFYEAVQRISVSLVHLASQYGERDADGNVMIDIRFTWQDLSNLVGVSRVTVNTITKKMMDNNIVSKQEKRLIILDMKSLEGLADGHLRLDG